jgi:pyruvate/2-oxoglutarate dehydrogenase complex dihydrolipoamide acyltransferase (E2) component
MQITSLRKNVWIRGLLWAIGGLVALLVLAWLALPSVLKSQLEARGTQALGRTLSVGSVEFKPWTLELTLTDIRLASADGKSTQLELPRVYVDASMATLWRMAPVLDGITIERPHLALAHLGQGHYDIDDVLQRLQSAPAAPAAEPARFALYNLVLSDGSADFVDHVAGREQTHQLRKLRLALPFLSSFDAQRDVSVQPQLAFEFNGSAFDSAAQATPFAQARKGQATLQISHLDMAPYLPYLPASLPVRLKAAVLDSSLKLAFEQGGQTSVVVSGSVKVSDIQLQDRLGGELLSVASIETVIKELRPLEQSLALESLDVKAPSLLIARNRAGDLNLLPGSAADKPGKPSAAAPVATLPAKAPASAPATAKGPADSGGWKLALARLHLQGGQLRFDDAAVTPAVRLALSETELTLSGLQWPFVKPAQWQASAKLQAQGGETGKAGKANNGAKAAKAGTASTAASIQLSGAGTPDAGTLKARWSDLGLPLAAPYLTSYLQPQVAGVLEGEVSATWQGGAVQLLSPRLALHDFALSPPSGQTTITAKELPSFALLEASDLAVDLSKRTVKLGKLLWRKPVLRLARGDDGQWMFAHWLPPKPAAPGDEASAARANAQTTTAEQAKAKAPAKSAPWSVAVADTNLDAGTLTYVDRLPAKTVFLEFSELQTRLQQLTLEGTKPAPLTLSAKVRSGRADPGKLRFDGKLMWAPLLLEGQLDAAQFPAHALAPYGLAGLQLELLRADTSFKGQLRYASLAAGADIQVRGDASIEELKLNSLLPRAVAEPSANLAAPASAAASPASPANASTAAATATSTSAAGRNSAGESEELLSWKALSAPGLEFSMAPGVPLRLKLREVSLADLYARLIINPQGRLVLQDIVGGDKQDAPAAADASAAPAAAPAASAPAPTPAPVASSRDPQIDIGPIRLVNGRVAFSDRFIQPHYSADLSDLQGSLSAFSSHTSQAGAQLADLELHGRAEGTAILDITGKLNPLARPLELNINGRVRDLELSPLSSYAIKYAGYGIERGKLSVDVNYALSPDGQLQAKNKIVLNQLVFGDEVAGVKQLPVKLAVALLADSNGVIDLDLPLSGSLNDPQFRVWPIVWKVVGNILAKALTSPFALISRALSGADGADALSSVAFDAGTARISESALPGLDKVASAMLDKPSLRLTVVGTASLEREREAIQRNRLDALLLAEKRRQAASAGKDVTAVLAVSPEEAPAVLKEVYRRSSIKKPRNVLGLARDLEATEMQTLLLQSMPVDEDTVRALALSRSLAVRDYLTAKKLPSERLFLGAAKTTVSAADWQARVELSIEQR